MYFKEANFLIKIFVKIVKKFGEFCNNNFNKKNNKKVTKNFLKILSKK